MADYPILPVASRNKRFAMVAGGSTQRDTQFTKLATLCGWTAIMMDDERHADYLLVDFCSETEILTDSLSRITDYLHRSTISIDIGAPH